jgi:molecular chaperone GrpE
MSPKEDKKKKQTREKENAPVKKGAKPAAKINKDKLVIEELTKQLMNVDEKQLRLKAEFENFRKRKEKEILDLIRYEGKDVVKAMISVVDDLERLYAAVEKNDNLHQSLKEGMALILSKVEKVFSELDVASFGEAGDLLDSELHDALMVRQEKDKNDNEIIDVFEKGYKYRERVIRHAKVVVNKT